MKFIFLWFFCLSISAFGQMGTLILNSSPSGADVFVDGKPKGKTPMDLMLTTGNHKISIQKKENIYLWSNQESINIKNLEVKRLQIDLNKNTSESGITFKNLDKNISKILGVDIHDGLIKAYIEENLVGYLDVDGNWVIQPSYRDGSDFNQGIAQVVTQSKNIQYINTKGEIVLGPFIESNSQEFGYFSEGIALKHENFIGSGYYNLKVDYTTFDTKGNQLGKIQVEQSDKNNPNRFYIGSISRSVDGLLLYTSRDYNNNELYGFMNKKLEIEITAKYRYCKSFSEGLAVVKNQNGLYGYIDKKENEVILFKFDDADDFSEGLALVRTGKNYFYIDKSGNKAFNTDFDIGGGSFFRNGYATVNPKFNESISYIINKNGKVVYDLGSNFYHPSVGNTIQGGGNNYYILKITPK